MNVHKSRWFYTCQGPTNSVWLQTHSIKISSLSTLMFLRHTHFPRLTLTCKIWKLGVSSIWNVTYKENWCWSESYRMISVKWENIQKEMLSTDEIVCQIQACQRKGCSKWFVIVELMQHRSVKTAYFYWVFLQPYSKDSDLLLWRVPKDNVYNKNRSTTILMLEKIRNKCPCSEIFKDD